jgi:hypothetical protein
MGKYKTFGSRFDRVHRNDLNANFAAVETDINAQKNRVDDLIKKVPQPSEVVDSRGGFPVLRDRLDNLSSSLAQSTTNVESVTKNPSNYTGAVVTFIDDDCDPSFKSIWQPILNTQGINLSLACVTGRVGQSNCMTLQELKDLQSAGNDILSHTINHYSTRGSAVELLETEFKDSQQWLKSNGFNGHDVLVYPGGIDPAINYIYVKDIARKYYKYAVSTLGTYNALPVDNWAMQRPNIDTSTLEQLKTHVDNAVANNGWLVFLSHSYELIKDQTNNITKLNALIDYIQSLNVPILPFSKAEKLKGNAVAIGEYTSDKGTFISADGSTKLSNSIVSKGTVANTYDMDASITTYKKNAKTIMSLSYVADKFLATGGVMEVYRGDADVYSYATFRAYNSTQIYIRRWNFNTNVWYAWEPLGAYTTGTWTPVLVGSTTAGTHTYTTQVGSYVKFANMVTVRFWMVIPSANFDVNMAGNVRIQGLPFPCAAGQAGKSRELIEMSKVNLGTNYTYPFAGIGAGLNYIEMYKGGNGVSVNYLNTSEIDKTGTVVLTGSINYQII